MPSQNAKDGSDDGLEGFSFIFSLSEPNNFKPEGIGISEAWI